MSTDLQRPIPAPVLEIIQKLRALEVIEPSHLSAALARTTITRQDLHEYLFFRDDEFSCQNIWNCSRLEINCICWRPGQASPLHHHAVSDCCVRVIEGRMTNTDLVPDGCEYGRRDTELAAGQLLVRRHRQIHQISNQSNQDLVTLHVYSPPLKPLEERMVR